MIFQVGDRVKLVENLLDRRGRLRVRAGAAGVFAYDYRDGMCAVRFTSGRFANGIPLAILAADDRWCAS